MVHGTYEPIIKDFVIQSARSTKNLVNIGANSGYFPCIAANAGYQKVIAVEPNKINYKILNLNISKNKFFNVQTIQAACSANTGIANLWGRNTGASLLDGWEGNPTTGVVRVKTLTLDSIFESIPKNETTLTIIDVEGFEFEVMKGSTNILNDWRNVTWIVEISLWRDINGVRTLAPYLSEIFTKFLNAGYRAHACSEGWPLISNEELDKYIKGSIDWPALPFLFKR